jgi:hypothetical protein
MEECIGASMFLRKFFDLPCQIAHRPEPHASFLRVKTVPVVSVALALRAASAGCTAMHPVGREPLAAGDRQGRPLAGAALWSAGRAR